MATRDEPAAPRHPLWNFLLRLYCQLVVVLVLYVFSTGPMYWTVYEAFNMGGSTFLVQLYWPIAKACEIDAVSRWFDWYVGLWIL